MLFVQLGDGALQAADLLAEAALHGLRLVDQGLLLGLPRQQSLVLQPLLGALLLAGGQAGTQRLPLFLQDGQPVAQLLRLPLLFLEVGLTAGFKTATR